MITGGTKYEAKYQPQYFFDVAKSPLCLRPITRKLFVLNLKDDAINKEHILNSIYTMTRGTDNNNNPTVIMTSGYSSHLGFYLPNGFHITVEELSDDSIRGRTLLVNDAFFGNIYEQICNINRQLVVITHPFEKISYTTKELLNIINQNEKNLRLYGILTEFLLEKLHSDDIMKDINLLKKTKVIWDYATEDLEKNLHIKFMEK